MDGPCSVTCGKGTQNKFSECSSPYPQNGGKSCTGQRTIQTECNEQECCPGKKFANFEKHYWTIFVIRY